MRARRATSALAVSLMSGMSFAPPCPVADGDLPLVLRGSLGLRALSRALASMPLSPWLAERIEEDWDQIDDDAQGALMENGSLPGGLVERLTDPGRDLPGFDIGALCRNPSLRGALADRMIGRYPVEMCANPSLTAEQQGRLLAEASGMHMAGTMLCVERLAARDGLDPEVAGRIAAMGGLAPLALCRAGGLPPGMEESLLRGAHGRAAGGATFRRFSAASLRLAAEEGILTFAAARLAPVPPDAQVALLLQPGGWLRDQYAEYMAGNGHLCAEAEAILIGEPRRHPALARRPRVGPATESALLQADDWRALQELAMNPWTSGPTLARLSLHHETAVWAEACGSPWFTDPGAHLAVVRSGGVERAMVLVENNPSIRGLGVFDALARSRSSRVRRGAAAHPMMVFPSLQAKLARDEGPGVSVSLRRNPTVASGLRPASAPAQSVEEGEEEPPAFPGARRGAAEVSQDVTGGAIR